MSRVLVIGWDGGTWSVAGPLTDEGRLPTLRSLRDGGAEGTLRSVPNMNSAPAWSTVATGLDPGRHGIFYFDERVPGSYGRQLVNAERRAGATLWRMASEAGKRIIVVNVPISYPAETVNGSLVAGLDTPAKSLPGFAYPRDLPTRYASLFRDYIVEPDAPPLVLAGRVQEGADALMRSVDGWTNVTEALMKDEEWDLVFVVFTSTDTTQHFFWTPERFDVVKKVYEVQDEATARLVELARSQDPDVNVVILADHGGEANTRGPEFMPVWLEDQGLMARVAPKATARALAGGFRLADRVLSRERKRALAKRFPRLQQRAQAESRLAGIAWDRTRAFADGVRDDVLVNLEGREPEGAVAADSYDAFIGELSQAISGIREAETGRPAVSEVFARDASYRGPFVERAPDLTVRWTIDGTPFRGFEVSSSAARDRMRAVAATQPAQPGGHHPDGMFVAKGPNVRPGAPVAGRLADVTPTILALLGAPVPAGLDGTTLDVLRDAEARVGPALVSEDAATTNPSGYTVEEEEAIRQRLEDLGYI